jgi:hypothetical protein
VRSALVVVAEPAWQRRGAASRGAVAQPVGPLTRQRLVEALDFTASCLPSEAPRQLTIRPRRPRTNGRPLCERPTLDGSCARSSSSTSRLPRSTARSRDTPRLARGLAADEHPRRQRADRGHLHGFHRKLVSYLGLDPRQTHSLGGGPDILSAALSSGSVRSSATMPCSWKKASSTNAVTVSQQDTAGTNGRDRRDQGRRPADSLPVGLCPKPFQG